jgi:phosphohistidine phosphatase
MRLYLLRHGTAEPHAIDDTGRKLVMKGKRQCQQAARMLERLAVRPDVVISSPLLRARQSAEVVIEGLGLELSIREEPALAPTTPAEEALLALIEGGGEWILAVGHEPLLSEIAALLIHSPSISFDLRKGGLLEIEIIARRPPRGVLVGLLRPAHMKT